MSTYDPEIDFPEAYNICKPFMLTDDNLITIRNSMTKEVLAGLNRDTHARSSIPCMLSYVQKLPTGQERGRYLALEMWPTNCRILLVKLGSEKDIYISSKCVIVPHTVAGSRSTMLFDFLAEQIAIFLKEKKVEKDNLPMGIAFAFAMNKLAVDVGILVAWTKGYGAQAAIGMDVVQLLRNALAVHKDISLHIECIVNVALGSLLGLCWSQNNCRLGLSVGTSVNAAYVEQTDECEMYEGDDYLPLMMINTEFGNFGGNGHLDFIRTEIDKIADAHSSNPGSKFYEKCISTLYMGELVRLIIVKLMKMGVIFKEHNLDYMGIQWKMEMKSLMDIDSDPPGVYVKAQQVMDKFRMRNCQERDLAMLHFITQTVTTRSAQLVAAGVACLLDRMGYAQVSIAVDGGVYRLYPRYQVVLNRYTTMLTDPHHKFEYVIAQESPGAGAAITAGLKSSVYSRFTTKG